MQKIGELIEEYILDFYEDESVEEFEFKIEDVEYLMRLAANCALDAIRDSEDEVYAGSASGFGFIRTEAIEELKQSIE